MTPLSAEAFDFGESQPFDPQGGEALFHVIQLEGLDTYTAGDGLELTGTQFKAKGTPYQNVVIVAKSGGDYTSVRSALTSITDNSSTNRYLVWVAPGVYTAWVVADDKRASTKLVRVP